MSYLSVLRLTGPEVLLVAAALGVLLVDLTVLRDQPARLRRQMSAAIAALGCLSAGLYILNVPAFGEVPGGMFLADPLTQMVKLILLALTLLTLGLSLETESSDHVSEYFALVLVATTGMLIMVSAGDLLLVFLSLELTGLSLYALVAWRKTDAASAEAALKYFFFGALAAALALFGFSLLYGITGETQLAAVAASLRGRGFDPLLAAALLLVLVSFGFKAAAVPFHLWAPDAYQGAPLPAAALVASGSKVAGVFLLARVLVIAFPESAGGAAWAAFEAGWMPVLALLAFASLLLGNLAALAQRRLKRLLAYSAIAHAGHLLLGVLAVAASHSRAAAFAALVFYAATYGLTAIGAFGVAALLERSHGSDALAGLAGWGRRSPWLAGCLAVLMLSLAGLPPFAGFLAKFYVFAAALQVDGARLGLLWLVITALALSPVALYYYLRVLKQAYVSPTPSGNRHEAAVNCPPEERSETTGIPWPEVLVVAAAAAGVLGLGLFPEALLGPLMTAIQAAGL